MFYIFLSFLFQKVERVNRLWHMRNYFEKGASMNTFLRNCINNWKSCYSWTNCHILLILDYPKFTNTSWNDIFLPPKKTIFYIRFINKLFSAFLLNIKGCLYDFSIILKSLFDPSMIITRFLDDLKSPVFVD